MRWLIFLIAASCGFALDIGTKEWTFDTASLRAPGGRIEVVRGWFDLELSENRGAAWGLLWGKHTFFLLVSVVAFIAISFFVHTAPRRSKIGPFILGLVLAGVAGNFWDRATNGAVRDFLAVHTPDTGLAHDFFDKVFGRTRWPTFNVADMFICTGAGALVVMLWREEKKKPAEASPAGNGAPAGPPPPAPPVPDPVAAPPPAAGPAA